MNNTADSLTADVSLFSTYSIKILQPIWQGGNKNIGQNVFQIYAVNKIKY